MIKQLIPKKACLKCHGCCRFARLHSIWSPCLLGSEIKGLINNGIPPSAISSRKRIKLIPRHDEEGFICIFLDSKDNRCKIYSLRPFECRLYPFLINRKLDKIFLALDLKCPFVEENFNRAEFKKYTRYMTGLFRRAKYQNILKNNPQIIQKYPEALNLAELKF